MKVSPNQIRVSKAEFQKLTFEVRKELEKKYPYPSREEVELWEKKNPHPRTKYNNKIDLLVQPFRREFEDVIFDAGMGQLTSEEFYSKVKNIRDKILKKK